MEKVVFFDTVEELSKLTGIGKRENHWEELWENDFNLDDWDFGIQTESDWKIDDFPYYRWWLLLHMENHCVGYQHTFYNGKHYYIVYHS